MIDEKEMEMRYRYEQEQSAQKPSALGLGSTDSAQAPRAQEQGMIRKALSYIPSNLAARAITSPELAQGLGYMGMAGEFAQRALDVPAGLIQTGANLAARVAPSVFGVDANEANQRAASREQAFNAPRQQASQQKIDELKSQAWFQDLAKTDPGQAQYFLDRTVPGTTLAGIMGSMVAGSVLPVARIPGLGALSRPATKMAGRIAQSGVQGAIGGLANPMIGPDGQAVTQEQAGQDMAWRAIGGGLIGALIPAGGGSAGEAVRKAPAESMITPGTPDMVRSFQNIGATPTVGAVTRNPQQWTKEFNLSGVDVGGPNPIAQAKISSENAVRKVFQDMGAGDVRTQADVGERLQELARLPFEQKKKVASDLYSAFRTVGAGDMPIPTGESLTRIREIVSTGGGLLPADIRESLSKVGASMKIDEAESIIKRINANYNPMNPPQKRMFDQIRGTIETMQADALSDPQSMAKMFNYQNLMTGKGRTTTGDMTRMIESGRDARKTFSDAMKMKDSSKALQSVLDGDDASKFVNKYVINASPEEFQALRKVVGQENQEANEIFRGQIANHLRNAAFGKDVLGDSPAAAARFANELAKIGDDKLAAVFTPAEVGKLRDASRVMAAMSQAPSSAMPNRAGTANALRGMLEGVIGKAMGVPMLGQVLGAGRSVLQKGGVVRDVENAMDIGRLMEGPKTNDFRNSLADLIQGAAYNPRVGTLGGLLYGRDGK